MARLTIVSATQQTVKPILVIGGSEAKQVLEIGGMTRSGCVYKPKDLAEAEEKKRKRKALLAEEQQKKKRVTDDDAAEFIMTLKQNGIFDHRTVEKATREDLHIIYYILSTDA